MHYYLTIKCILTKQKTHFNFEKKTSSFDAFLVYANVFFILIKIVL